MRYTELRVGLKRTVNLGNYESASFEIGVTVNLEDEGNPVTGGGVDPSIPDHAAAFRLCAQNAWNDAARLLGEERKRRLPPRPESP